MNNTGSLSLREIAEFYVELIMLATKVPKDDLVAKEEITALRSKYHELLMEKMREEGVEFADRLDAAYKAVDLVKEAPHENDR